MTSLEIEPNDSKTWHNWPAQFVPTATDRLLVRSHGLTDRGQVRSTNEDHFLIADLGQAMRARQSSHVRSKTQYSVERGQLMLVADGMGGHNAGEEASALAVDTIAEHVLHTARSLLHKVGVDKSAQLVELQQAMLEADRRIFEAMDDNTDWHGMGTTATLAYYFGRHLFVAHVGDSRCYLLRNGQLRQLTDDHTLINELRKKGLIRPEDTLQRKYRHMITNVLGGNEVGARVDAQTVEIQPGDVVLLCTDGLTDKVPDTVIHQILTEEPDPQAACARLMKAANERVTEDNLTVVVARFETPE